MRRGTRESKTRAAGDRRAQYDESHFAKYAIGDSR
jgi:hypothetical protein